MIIRTEIGDPFLREGSDPESTPALSRVTIEFEVFTTRAVPVVKALQDVIWQMLTTPDQGDVEEEEEDDDGSIMGDERGFNDRVVVDESL